MDNITELPNNKPENILPENKSELVHEIPVEKTKEKYAPGEYYQKTRNAALEFIKKYHMAD